MIILTSEHKHVSVPGALVPHDEHMSQILKSKTCSNSAIFWRFDLKILPNERNHQVLTPRSVKSSGCGISNFAIFQKFSKRKIFKANVENPAYFSTTRPETRPHEAHFYVLTPCQGKSWKKMSEIGISDIFHVRNHVRNLPPCMCGAPRIMHHHDEIWNVEKVENVEKVGRFWQLKMVS